MRQLFLPAHPPSSKQLNQLSVSKNIVIRPYKSAPIAYKIILSLSSIKRLIMLFTTTSCVVCVCSGNPRKQIWSGGASSISTENYAGLELKTANSNIAAYNGRNLSLVIKKATCLLFTNLHDPNLGQN